MMKRAITVIPCYNEEKRLELHEFSKLLHATGSNSKLLFVNDGSKDETVAMLRRFAETEPAGRIEILDLEKNSGKAEAVRRGMVHALAEDAEYVGYVDADLAAPVAEYVRVLDTLRDSNFEAAFGARVRLLGLRVERKLSRHYLGRIFATLASMSLCLPIYDTQCGAKVFKNTKAVRESLSEKFVSRWAFDVELIGRVATHPDVNERSAFREVPLHAWAEVGGSKLGAKAMIRAGLDLGRIALFLRKRRAIKAATLSAMALRA